MNRRTSHSDAWDDRSILLGLLINEDSQDVILSTVVDPILDRDRLLMQLAQAPTGPALKKIRDELRIDDGLAIAEGLARRLWVDERAARKRRLALEVSFALSLGDDELAKEKHDELSRLFS